MDTELEMRTLFDENKEYSEICYISSKIRTKSDVIKSYHIRVESLKANRLYFMNCDPSEKRNAKVKVQLSRQALDGTIKALKERDLYQLKILDRGF